VFRRARQAGFRNWQSARCRFREAQAPSATAFPGNGQQRAELAKATAPKDEVAKLAAGLTFRSGDAKQSIQRLDCSRCAADLLRSGVSD